MKSKISVLRTVIVLAILPISIYIVACDAGGSVAIKPAEACETNNTAELTIQNNSETIYSIYIDDTYVFSLQKSMVKTQTVSAGVNHKVDFKTESTNVKCTINKNLEKCTSGTVACSN
jgi:hypothetical protein